jgi:hypothetical protein
MRIEDLTVALRPRSGFEAIELGFAMSRRHAGRVLAAWLIASLPVLSLLLAMGWALELMWLPSLLMWWLKPLFARIPLYVYSRALFGHVPGLREILRAQLSFGLRALLPWLLWRRPLPNRGLMLPVDLLEGLRGPALRTRRRAIGHEGSMHAALLFLVCMNIEALLFFSGIALVVLLVPIEFMGDAAKAIWDTLLIEPPDWAQALAALLYWLCVSIVEPLHVGGGFGLYVNRRTRLEAWDIELGFRRLAARLAPATGLCLALLIGALGLGAGSAQAADVEVEDRAGPFASELPSGASGFKRVFAQAHMDGSDAFVEHSARVYEGPELSPFETRGRWVRREPLKEPPQPRRKPGAFERWMRAIGNGMAFAVENILWLGAGLLLALAALNYRHWWPRLQTRLAPSLRPRPRSESLPEADAPLPDDLVGAVRRLWQQGRARAALALLYRGALAQLAQRLDEPLPPGSTEADGLRRARRLADPDFGALFARTVSCWQAAAYAHRLPAGPEFEGLLDAWQRSLSPSAIEAAA